MTPPADAGGLEEPWFQTKFSNEQMAQLRSVVQDAIRAEFPVHRRDFQAELPAEKCSSDEQALDALPECVRAQEAEVIRVHRGQQSDVEELCRGNSVECEMNPRAKKEANTQSENHIGLPGRTHSMTLTQYESGGLWSDSMNRAAVNPKLAFVNSSRFDFAVGVVIILNAAMVGIETQMRLEGERSDVLRVFELFCLSVFLLELVLRVLATGRTALKSNWIRFDAFLVFSGLLSLLVLQPLQDEAGIPPDIVRSADMLLLLRLMRFIRVAKILRLLPLFNDMWKMCNGLIKAMNTMFSVVVLMMISIYLFACLGVDLISQSEILAEDQSTRRIVEHKFSSVGRIMLTLMQFADADSIAEVYAPLCMRQPLLALYFGAVWLILTVSLMNVVTAIILETAMAKGRDEAQEQLLEKRRVFTHIRPSLLELFDTLDSDQSGVLTLDEIALAVKNRTVEFPPEIAESVTPAQMVEAFDFLDTDMSGKIDRKEFVEGVLVMVLSSVPLETAQILHLLRRVFSMVVQTSQNVKRLTEGGAQSMPLGNLQSVKSPGSVS